MWQRIQTIFLIVVLIAAGVETGLSQNWWGQSLAIAAVILTLVSLVSYKKQNRQMLVNRVHLFLQICILVFLSGLLSLLPGEEGVSNPFSEKVIEWYLPLLAMVGLILANTYIRRDYKLVKSIERLR